VSLSQFLGLATCKYPSHSPTHLCGCIAKATLTYAHRRSRGSIADNGGHLALILLEVALE